MFYINLLKHQIKRLDRIIIQLFEKLGHYVRVFFLLFLVERSTRPARPFSENNIFGQTVSRNCFGVVKARNFSATTISKTSTIYNTNNS